MKNRGGWVQIDNGEKWGKKICKDEKQKRKYPR